MAQRGFEIPWTGAVPLMVLAALEAPEAFDSSVPELRHGINPYALGLMTFFLASAGLILYGSWRRNHSVK